MWRWCDTYGLGLHPSGRVGHDFDPRHALRRQLRVLYGCVRYQQWGTGSVRHRKIRWRDDHDSDILQRVYRVRYHGS